MPARPFPIVLLTQFWAPEIGAPQNRLGEFARWLKRFGWDVSVITAQPNYPTGKVYDGYSPWRFTREEHDGIAIHRCPLFASRSTRTAVRLSSYVSFAAAAALAGAKLLPRDAVLFVESPPLFLGMAALALQRLKGVRYVFNVSDLWPDSAVEMGWVADGPAVRAARELEAACYRNAAALTGQAPDIVGKLRERAPGKTVELITNSVDIGRFDAARRDEVWRKRLGAGPGDVIAGFFGLHGAAQGLDQLLDAMQRLRDEKRLHLVLVGDGAEKPRLAARARDEKIERVHFLDPVPRDRVPALLKSCDIAAITLGYNLTGAIPSKIYEALAAGLPTLLVAGAGAARVITEADAGMVCAVGDVAAITDGLRRLTHDAAARTRCGRNAREAAQARYSREGVARKLDALLLGLAERNG